MKNAFLKDHVSLTELFLDKELAKLGDSFVNFIFSLAVSNKNGMATNVRVKGIVLAQALKKKGYRKYLPSRIDRHKQADAVEALIIYSWLKEKISIEECVTILQQKAESPSEAFTDLITAIINRLDFIVK